MISPPRDATPKVPDAQTVHVVGAAIVRPRICLVARRAAHVSNAGLWEFPGGKVEPGESPRQALVREVWEELEIRIEAGAFLGRGTIEKNDRPLVLDVYLSTWRSGELRFTDHDAVRWIAAPQVSQLAWAPADIPILPALEKLLGADAPKTFKS